VTVVKNRSTPEGREFWDHVEKVAAQVRGRGEMSALFALVLGLGSGFLFGIAVMCPLVAWSRKRHGID
jgi:hypothetical protein